MKDLKRLIRIIKKKGQRSIQLVNINFRKKEISKDNLLYEGITSHQFETDEEAAQAIFQTDPGNRNYRNAKGKLKYKLLNHLYFLDYDKDVYTQYDRCEYACMHTLHQCKILINEKAPDVALRLLPQLVKTAKDFEFVRIAEEALVLLRDQYAIRGKVTPFSETQEELDEYRKFSGAFQACEDLYHSTLVHLNKSISAQNRVIDRIPEAIEKIHKTAKQYKSQALFVLASKLSLLHHAISWDFDSNIKLCTELEKKYLNCPNEEVSVHLDKQEIAFTRLTSYLNQHNASDGKAYAKTAIRLFRTGSRNWFRFAEYYFLLLFQDEQFEEAGQLFRQIRTNKNYNTLPKFMKSRWNIYRAYLIFFNEAKILRWGFNIEEFITTKPAFPKKYNGLNVATLVIQFLYLLREGYVEEFKTCVAELEQYKSAHLDKRHNYRSSIFIRMLEVVVEKEFDYDKISEKGNTYYKKLLKHRIPADLNTDTEVLPYEKLWEHVLGILKTNKAYIHFRFYNAKAM